LNLQTSQPVLYLIQTFDGLSQIKRLVTTVLASDPKGRIIISHNSDKFNIAVDDFDEHERISVMNLPGGNRVNFYQADGMLKAIAFAEKNSINFSWVVNITGQCYPIQPLNTLKENLELSGFDAHIFHGEVFGKKPFLWPEEEALARYAYRYHWRLTLHELSKFQHFFWSALREIVNRTQKLFRIDTAYALQIGKRHSDSFLPEGWCLYGGFIFMALGRRAALRLLDFSENNTVEMWHFRQMIMPTEVFAHTVLANQPDINIGHDVPVYVHYDNNKRGRPRVLTTADLATLYTKKHYYFARKFDAKVDSFVFDELDKHLFNLNK
jgi:hypothetical protein